MIDPALKNRLVGVVVLLLLAVLLLPVLFDGANEQALLADTRMPQPPDVPSAGSLLGEPPSIVPETESAIDAAHAPAEPEIPPVAVAPGAPPEYAVADTAGVAEVGIAPATVKAVPPPAPAATGPVPAVPAVPAKPDPRLASLAEAWDVQVAAVSTLESAQQLRGKLAAAGYKSRVLAAGKLFRVVVGPELRREDATALRDKLAVDARFGKPKGMLVRYVP